MVFPCITQIAHFAPNKVVANDDLSQFVDTNDEWISSRTGIKTRHISTNEDENTSDLCAKVGKALLEKSGYSPLDIDLLLVATVTPDSIMPCCACLAQQKIGAFSAVAFDISGACSGFVFALSVAEKFVRTGAYKKAMVIGADVLSKALDWSDRSTCVLFGDGAGGVLVEQGSYDSFLGEDLCSDGSLHSAFTYNPMPVANAFAPTPAATNPYIYMDGRKIFDFVVKKVPKSLQTVFEKTNTTVDDVSYIIPHQANLRIVEAVAKKLKIDMSKFYTNLGEFGNTSAASIPIALSEMQQKGLLHIGGQQKLMLTAFGAGLTWGTMLLKI